MINTSNTKMNEQSGNIETTFANTSIIYPNNSSSKRVKIHEPPLTTVVLGGVEPEETNNLMFEKPSSSASSFDEEEEERMISHSGSDEAVPLRLEQNIALDISHKRKNNLTLIKNNIDVKMAEKNEHLMQASPIAKTRRSRTISGGKSEDHFMTTQSGRVIYILF